MFNELSDEIPDEPLLLLLLLAPEPVLEPFIEPAPTRLPVVPVASGLLLVPLPALEVLVAFEPESVFDELLFEPLVLVELPVVDPLVEAVLDELLPVVELPLTWAMVMLPAASAPTAMAAMRRVE